MQHICDFHSLMSSLRSMPGRRRVAVACPSDAHTGYAITRALDEGTADFVLACCGAAAWPIDDVCSRHAGRVELLSAPTPDEAARMAVGAVRQGRADVLMKGALNTDNLLRAVLDKERGLLLPGSVMSHLTAIESPDYPKLLFATDVAVIPKPTLEQFDAMLRYAVAACCRLGVDVPHVALIHCSEKTSDKFPQTLSYLELKRRAAAGAYGDAVVDGPMDVKTACDAHSAQLKGISSPVAGRADVLVFPGIEAGNTFYKTMSLFGHARMAGMLCGTTAPVVLASRADAGPAKYASLALACAAGACNPCNAPSL